MMLRNLFRTKPPKVDANKLPQRDSFVEVTIRSGPLHSVAIEEVGDKEIVTREVLGRAGDSAVFLYQTPLGRFRFSTRIISCGASRTNFSVPLRVEALGDANNGEQKRSDVRLDTLVPGGWRFAPGGEGVGEFIKGNVRDISRGGCALISERKFKIGQLLELRLTLRTGAPPVELLGQVMRAQDIPSSGRFSHGIRFQGVAPQYDREILEFINRKQTDLRNRGLA